MRLEHVVIARPGGNDTALVFDQIPATRRKTINKLIQEQYPKIEQVMFVDGDCDPPRGLMTGGEFCGNATRALGYYLLNGANGRVKIATSGCRSTLDVEVLDGRALAQMPIFHDFDHIMSLSPTRTIIHLEGISYLVLAPGDAEGSRICALSSPDEQKKSAGSLLKHEAFSQAPAMGVIVVTKESDGYSIKPFVYVRAIDTFYFETACGSGSVAVGLVWAWQRKKGIRNLVLRQPSGMTISVDVWLKENRFERASIGGPVSILYEGSLLLEESDATLLRGVA